MSVNPWAMLFGLVKPVVVGEPTYQKKLDDTLQPAPEIEDIRNQPGFLKEKIVALNDADYDLVQIAEKLDCNVRYVRRVLIRAGRIEKSARVRKKPDSIKRRKGWRTVVVALTLDGKYVETYASISKASIAIKCSTSAIHLVINKKIPTVKGCQFMTLEEYEKRKSEDLSVKYLKKPEMEVVALTPDGKHYCTYPSVNRAASAHGCSSAAIYAVINNKKPTAKGLRFMSKEDYERRNGEDLSVKFKVNKK